MRQWYNIYMKAGVPYHLLGRTSEREAISCRRNDQGMRKDQTILIGTYLLSEEELHQNNVATYSGFLASQRGR